MDEHPNSRLLVGATLGLGAALFTGLRWEVLTTESLSWPNTAWLALPILLTFVGAASIGLILLKDGVTRWWWLPATGFVLLGLPVESWVGSASLVATRIGPVAGSALDLIVVLAPGAVLALCVPRTRTVIHDRVVPTVVVVAVSVAAAMLVGAEGPDASLSVGFALLAFGVCSQSASWRRALTFFAVAIALGAQVPGSFATSAAQGDFFGGLAVVDASMEVVVALLAFSIAPLTTAWRYVLRRHGANVIAETR